MAGASDRVGEALRFIASGGMADEDPDIVADLLAQARRMADLAVADNDASPQLRALAADFLRRLKSDTFNER